MKLLGLSRGLGHRAAGALQRERVIILGVGWAGFRLAKDLDKAKFDVTLVAPRNHFLFTPLLPSTTVGTLEFRCVQEPARTIKGVNYFQAWATRVDYKKKIVQCRDVYQHHEAHHKSMTFDVPYDYLMVAVGTKSNTFQVPGIESREEAIDGEEPMTSPTGTSRDHVYFLKQLEHARSIRNRVLECFERASSPFISSEERRRLLTFVIVGGGPTSIEFASELCDFLQHDVTKWYRDLGNDYRVIIIEASKHLLSSFDSSLSQYVEKTLTSRHGVEIITNETVSRIRDVSVVLGHGEREVPFGICVWSTGNAPLDFVKNRLGLQLHRDRIVVDDCFRVAGVEGVFALGDCAVNPERPLNMLAQVANQQAIHLAKCLNAGQMQPFEFKMMGMMAQLGTFKGVADLKGPKLKGLMAFLVWRLAYWTKSVSISNKILIPMFWFKSFWFGRDISKF